MSKIPSDPDTTEQQFKGQGVKHGTERAFWSRWPSRQAPAASAQQPPGPPPLEMGTISMEIHCYHRRKNFIV